MKQKSHDKPHYEPPYGYHADWPHSYVHRWNDTEMAYDVPCSVDCCNHEDADCVCITSGDVSLWNSYSGLSGLTAFDIDTLSSMSSQLSEMTDYSAVQYAAYTLTANSGIWNSAGYIPNIYENLSAFNSVLNNKMDASALSSWRVYTNSAQIVGLGTQERPLRLAKDLMKTIETVNMATDDLNVGLVNQNTVEQIYKDIHELAKENNEQQAELYEHLELIKILINQRTSSHGAIFVNKEVTLKESKKDPETFYYWQSTGQYVDHSYILPEKDGDYLIMETARNI